MVRCLHCAQEYEAGPSGNSEDSALEVLLQTLADSAMETGICGFDFMSGTHAPGTEIDSQQRHTNLAASVKQAKEAVHSHIQQNYEEDD